MTHTITCNKCHKTVYITDLQNGVDFNEKYLAVVTYRELMINLY